MIEIWAEWEQMDESLFTWSQTDFIKHAKFPLVAFLLKQSRVRNSVVIFGGLSYSVI